MVKPVRTLVLDGSEISLTSDQTTIYDVVPTNVQEVIDPAGRRIGREEFRKVPVPAGLTTHLSPIRNG